MYVEGKRGPKHKEFAGSRVPWGVFLAKFFIFVSFLWSLKVKHDLARLCTISALKDALGTLSAHPMDDPRMGRVGGQALLYLDSSLRADKALSFNDSLIRDERIWAIAVRRGSYKSLFLLNSGRFFL